MNAGQVGDLLGFDAALPQGYVDFVFGALDGASFGASALTRRLTGAQDAVNECSGYYTAGGWAAVAYDLLSGGGLIKGGLKGLRSARNLVDPRSLIRTHSIEGKRSSKRVKEIAESMMSRGYDGPPIDVVEHNGARYIIDGHHRAAAAIRTSTQVRINVVTDVAGHPSSYRSVEDVVRSAHSTGPNRLTLRERRKQP